MLREFCTIKIQISAYTQLKSKKKTISWGVRNSTERPKIRRLRRKGYRKIFQRLRHGMLHTGEYSVLFHWNLHLWPC